MRLLALLLVCLAPVSGFAQAVPTFTSQIGAEDVAPLPKPTAVTPTTPTSPSAPLAAATMAASSTNPFIIQNVTVTVSGTGFARDIALEKAARQALPIALQALPLDAAQATSITKTIGNPMSFVASYQVVKETLLPTYSLTTNLTFNQAMLRTNFGGQIISTTTVSGSTISPTAVAPVQKNTFVLRLSEPEPSTQNQIFQQLNALENTEARYRLITIQGAEYTVQTTLSETALTTQLGPLNAQIMPQFIPTPSPELSPTTLQ